MMIEPIKCGNCGQEIFTVDIQIENKQLQEDIKYIQEVFKTLMEAQVEEIERLRKVLWEIQTIDPDETQ